MTFFSADDLRDVDAAIARYIDTQKEQAKT